MYVLALISATIGLNTVLTFLDRWISGQFLNKLKMFFFFLPAGNFVYYQIAAGLDYELE